MAPSLLRRSAALLLAGSLCFGTSFAAEPESFLDAARTLVRHGIVTERTDPAEYRLDRTITRAEMAKIVFGFVNEYRSDDIVFGDCTRSPFPDVPKDHTLCRYVAGLANAGIIAPNGAFRPNDPVSRAEAATLVLRAIQERPSAGASPFRDVSEAAVGVHTGYIVRAVELGVIRGYPDGTFRPDASVTRGEAFMILSRLLK